MTTSERPRILFIDAYDSFSNNIISLLQTSLNVDVSTIKIDTDIPDLALFLKNYAAVVAGPGPGDARNVKDVGLFDRLWKLEGVEILPVLGICLGFQSLVLAYEGGIERLPEPRHGIVRKISSNEESIFRNIPFLCAVQYHSLHATLNTRDWILRNGDESEQLAKAESNVQLVPLAWDHQKDNDTGREEKIGEQNPQSILMAVKHAQKPFYGIQFHPESICSSLEARQIVRNWWDEICVWRATANNNIKAYNESYEKNYPNQERYGFPLSNGVDHEKSMQDQGEQSCVISQSVDLANLSLSSICEMVGVVRGKSIIFDSERHPSSETGAFSIVGIVEDVSPRFEYRIGMSEVLQICSSNITSIKIEESTTNIFTFLDSYMQKRKAKDGNPDIPFWGGLMGYISYEASLEALRVRDSIDSKMSHTRPDLCFVFIERSIVIDHVRSTVHIQSIRPVDHAWVNATTSLLSTPTHSTHISPVKKSLGVKICFPNEEQYKSRIRACQAAIRAGDSYELCLTNQANITTTSRAASWPLYCRLRNVNPAPFGAYIRLGDLTVLSSSPERFMRWSRPTFQHTNFDSHLQPVNENTSVLQFRPIKGTLARRPTPNSAARSLSEATRLLSVQKEQAENLMIVDLIRHDLHGVVGSGRVSVPKLMVVEEYETVFQLVSVIEGTMIVRSPQKQMTTSKSLQASNGDCLSIKNGFHNSSVSEAGNHNLSIPFQGDAGVTVIPSSTLQTKPLSPLAALPSTLPPGSMTGAPKLRSCQILRSLEPTSRGIYSGIIGYIDVGGGGDWSVAIRCAVRWDDSTKATGDHWTVGAGGAVTALSTEQGEWEEMLAKLQATLRVFQD